MTSTGSANASHATSRPSFGTFPGGSGSFLLEKGRSGLRKSTPDSEALASSDDEIEKLGPTSPAPTVAPMKPARRSSWLNDVQMLPQRKSSFAGPGSFSSTNSHPSTPLAESSTWPTSASSGTNRPPTAASAFTWGNAIWNSDTRKEPPSRLTEVLPSPTSLAPPNISPSFGEHDPFTKAIGRDHTGDSTIPFAIPLHPTPKTYRSQSYSVGQLDPELNNGPPSSVPGPHQAARARNVLHHRSSRPGMLSELAHEGTSLDRVREVDDDDDSTTGSIQGVLLPATEPHHHDVFARENARLRNSGASKSIENIRLRGSHGLPHAGHPIQESVPEESESAIDEIDVLNELHDWRSNAIPSRRYSEYRPDNDARHASLAMPENRKLESIKKGHWHSSLNFGGNAEGQQSRRHSFADVPARNDSISSVADQGYPSSGKYDGQFQAGGPRRDGMGTHVESAFSSPTDDTASYFSGLRPPQPMASLDQDTATLAMMHPGYMRPPTYVAGVTAPYSHRGLQNAAVSAAAPQMPHIPHPLPNQLLYVVTFKCLRAEIFYVQEGTGLQINRGDLVIVEADRGTDLGTVVDDNVTWQQAKDRKEYYAEEHFRWLMMFSRHSNQLDTGTGLRPPYMAPGSAVGGMGPQGGQQGGQDAHPIEVKPKMIKRLAQNHEIQGLREKEANEAKAKRVCQQKVAEHRLQMEILDAEFQVDWKKLTFYYFADAYINFNPLVTDLFKIYKTRIWMSAINPASFASPSLGLQAPGPAGLRGNGMGQDIVDHRQHADQPGPILMSNRAAYSPFERLTSDNHGAANSQPGSAPSPYAYGPPQFGHLALSSPELLARYAGGMQQQPYGPMDGNRIPGPHTSSAPAFADPRNGGSQPAANQVLFQSLQSLSLGQQ
ncbi:MAG: hypothetical protein M1817_002681 [Caeruleum heppii]|nr:MAG: hypothetical protein M1817_002681 [Caeruleum heppii]